MARNLGGGEEVFAAALFHDLGKLLLARHAPEDYHRVEHLAAEGKPLLEAEQELLGTTHPEVGAWACEAWRFPELLVA